MKGLPAHEGLEQLPDKFNHIPFHIVLEKICQKVCKEGRRRLLPDFFVRIYMSILLVTIYILISKLIVFTMTINPDLYLVSHSLSFGFSGFVIYHLYFGKSRDFYKEIRWKSKKRELLEYTVLPLLLFFVLGLSLLAQSQFEFLNSDVNITISYLFNFFDVTPLLHNNVGTDGFLTYRIFMGVIYAPIAEELVYRKYIIKSCKKRGPGFALSTLLFVWTHSVESSFALFDLFLFSLFFTAVYVITDDIKKSIFVHMLKNLFALVILPHFIFG